jgi:hypothetical protein
MPRSDDRENSDVDMVGAAEQHTNAICCGAWGGYGFEQGWAGHVGGVAVVSMVSGEVEGSPPYTHTHLAP